MSEEAYILQNEDNRIVFVIPYQQDYSSSAPRTEHKGSPREAKISDAEINYLCKVVNAPSPGRGPVTWSGPMPGAPLCDDESDSPQAVTRDYTLELSGESDGAPLLSVFGGKLTTYHQAGPGRLQQAQALVQPDGEDWTAPAGCPAASSTARCVNWRAPCAGIRLAG